MARANSSDKFKRITISLTPEQLDLLSEVSKTNGYDNMSATLRVIITKYAKKELKQWLWLQE